MLQERYLDWSLLQGRGEIAARCTALWRWYSPAAAVLVTRALLAAMNATSARHCHRHNVTKDGHPNVRAGLSPVLAPANYS